MEVVEVLANPYDLLKLGKGVAAFRPSRFIRCQVAGDNVWTNVSSTLCWRVNTWYGENGWTEIRAPGPISGRVGFRPLVKVGVSACSVIVVWRTASGVATIAVSNCVNQKAAQSHQIAISLRRLLLTLGTPCIPPLCVAKPIWPRIRAKKPRPSFRKSSTIEESFSTNPSVHSRVSAWHAHGR